MKLDPSQIDMITTHYTCLQRGYVSTNIYKLLLIVDRLDTTPDSKSLKRHAGLIEYKTCL